MQQGDLVTSANAPEGCPPWVGEVVRQDGGWGNCWWVQKLGHPVDTARGSDLRLLTDAEAVGLAEMLAGEKWRHFGTSGCLALFPSGGVIALVALRGEWSVTAPVGLSCLGRIAGGKERMQPKGIVAASRALILYTIRGQP